MLTTGEVLDQNYLETRCQLLEIAATLDRHDHARQAGQDQPQDGRLELICRALAQLAQRQVATDRSERLLNLFSDLT